MTQQEINNLVETYDPELEFEIVSKGDNDQNTSLKEIENEDKILLRTW